MTEDAPEQPSPPFLGRKLYSPRVIAAYTVFGNIPVGFVLYGLNLQARGSKFAGRLAIVAGIVGGIGLSAAALADRASSRPLILVSLFAAFSFYRFERAPVKLALQRGATLARWWPPGLFLLGALGVLAVAACFIP